MFNKKFFSTMFVICFLFTSISFGATVVKRDTFDNSTATFFDSFASETIKGDIIFNAVTMDKSYRSYLMSNNEAKLFAKNLRLHTEPAILEHCPLNQHTGVLYTGKANMITEGISQWYSMAGVMYNFDSLCDTLAISFSYLNTRPIIMGKVALIMQEVDENDVVLWEKIWTCAGNGFSKVWQNISFTKEKLALYLAGHKFNRVWLVETELYLDKVIGAGGYFDDITLTVTNSDPEPVVEPEPIIKELPPVIDPLPITPPTVEDKIISDIANEIMVTCPCNNQWKNHGEYVSCMAKAKEFLTRKHSESRVNSAIDIVNAAKSNCGKK